MPVLAAGAALAAAGTGLSIAANEASQSAINDARHKEALAQQDYQRRASNVFQNALPQNSTDAANADIAKGAVARQNVFEQLKNLANNQSGPSLNQNSGNAVAQAAERVGAAGDVGSENTAQAQSRLGGYGDWGTALGVLNSGVNSQLGVINNEARANANLLPLQIEAASHKGDALGMWGKIVSGLGSVSGGTLSIL